MDMKFILRYMFFFLYVSTLHAEEMQIRKFGQYKVVIDRPNDHDEGRVRIYRKGKKVYEEREFGSYFYLGNRFDDSLKGKDPHSGKDLNGNSIPDLIITQWTGGAHCCNYLKIFELGNNFRKLIEVSGGSSGFGVVDLDGDNFPEVEFWDWPIDYSFTGFSDSAQGRTILKFEKGKYQVSRKLMIARAPSVKRIIKIQNEIKNAFMRENQNIPYEFLNTMMELSYSGHMDLAFKIADKTWPNEKNGLTEFKIKFKNLLNASPYWREFTRN